MVTITLSERLEQNDGLFQVFGTHVDEQDRFVFGVRSFVTLTDAERYAKRMMEQHEADHFERLTPTRGTPR
jgi:hypothetical protein